MTRYELFKLIHVLAAIVWVGGTVLANIFGIRQQNASEQHQVGFSRDVEFLGNKVLTPAAFTALAFGILMVLTTDALSFGDTWIVIGLGGFALSAVIGMAVLGPTGKRLVTAMESGSAEAPALQKKIGMYAMIDMLILLFVVWAMVVKPG